MQGFKFPKPPKGEITVKLVVGISQLPLIQFQCAMSQISHKHSYDLNKDCIIAKYPFWGFRGDSSQKMKKAVLFQKN